MEQKTAPEAFIIRLDPGRSRVWQGCVTRLREGKPKSFHGSTELLQMMDRSIQEAREEGGGANP